MRRHSPHFNRGKPILKKGSLRGGNPKKKKVSSGGGRVDNISSNNAIGSSNTDCIVDRPPCIMNLEPGSTSVLPLRYSFWLCFSSLFFLMPVFLNHSLASNCGSDLNDEVLSPWLLTTVHALTSIASLNYWRRATLGWRRNIDIFIARLSFVASVIYGLIYVRNPIILGIGCAFAVSIPVLFFLSIALHNELSGMWLLAHAMMHAVIGLGMCIAIAGTYITESSKCSAEFDRLFLLPDLNAALNGHET